MIESMKPKGSQMYVIMAFSGVGRWTKRPSWKIMRLFSRSLGIVVADLVACTM